VAACCPLAFGSSGMSTRTRCLLSLVMRHCIVESVIYAMSPTQATDSQLPCALLLPACPNACACFPPTCLAPPEHF
jgi:hypothetical protein